MVQYIPAPEPRQLLPPLLACLPTAFIAQRPPPDFLPLLSPILRQRVQLLAGDSSTSSGSWLPLLCWDAQHASRLPAIVENMQLEPHPVSGEIELGDVGPATYRRSDAETLHARLELKEYGLAPIYLWCMGDESAGGHAWRLAELRILENGVQEIGRTWLSSITEADEASKDVDFREAIHDRGSRLNNSSTVSSSQSHDNGLDDDDDDGYWDSYDQTPGRTPAKRSPALVSMAATTDRKRSTSEVDYYARYENEVQPALDAEDPSEQTNGIHDSTLAGNELTQHLGQKHESGPPIADSLGSGFGSSLLPTLPGQESHNMHNEEYSHPRPVSASSAEHVERLELSVSDHSQAEVGIRQHIGAELKNLYRLARSAGIDRSEFDHIIQRELQSLSMFDMDE
ncbi:MAG: hypothetical protein M1822_000199 [Bathelium mastoideum]|nr:MAG: hypothetical protein M1822_000199 [Bathelium mastoideum]